LSRPEGTYAVPSTGRLFTAVGRRDRPQVGSLPLDASAKAPNAVSIAGPAEGVPASAGRRSGW
jgi:hypothetical protein